MNRIFKIIWSKAKNCYIVASELAKSRTKAPAGGVISHIVVAGVVKHRSASVTRNATGKQESKKKTTTTKEK